MKKRTIGQGLEVSAVGLGCMGFSHAYGTAVNEEEAIRTIREAADAGCTFFDTAEFYTGVDKNGQVSNNEQLVGKALKPIRNQVVIATKFGLQPGTGSTLIPDARPEVIRASLEKSLKNLDTDYIDLYYQHRIDPDVEPEVVAGVMKELIEEGKIRHWGVSEANEEYIRRAHAVCPLTAIQNRYSMMARWHENLFPVLEELGIGYVAFSPLANGILSDAAVRGEKYAADDYRGRRPQYADEAFEKNQVLLQLLRRLAEEKNATPAQISLAWMLNKKPYIVPIPGSRKIKRIQENLAAAEIELSAEEVAAIDEALDGMEMSEVFGGHGIQRREK